VRWEPTNSYTLLLYRVSKFRNELVLLHQCSMLLVSLNLPSSGFTVSCPDHTMVLTQGDRRPRISCCVLHPPCIQTLATLLNANKLTYTYLIAALDTAHWTGLSSRIHRFLDCLLDFNAHVAVFLFVNFLFGSVL